MTKIKICGITNLKDALMAIEAGADALGFIFAKSPRQIHPKKVRDIVTKLPPLVGKVGVFKNEKIFIVQEIMNFCQLDWIQLHGKEDSSYLKHFSQKAIKVFELHNKDIQNEIKRFSLPFFMLDLPKENFSPSLDWKLIREIKKGRKIILAGRLTPANVEQALRKAAPYGVDVCRGVEKKCGIKSPEKLKEFIVKVKTWDLQKNQENSAVSEENLSLKP